MPIKKKILRFNKSSFMTNALGKAIMHRSKLKNIYHISRRNENGARYKKQRKKNTENFFGTTLTLNKILQNFQYYPSIKRIRETFNNNEKFSFTEVTEHQLKK